MTKAGYYRIIKNHGKYEMLHYISDRTFHEHGRKYTARGLFNLLRNRPNIMFNYDLADRDLDRIVKEALKPTRKQLREGRWIG